jgi:peptidoglycan/xylan/chitin deacetylase (PgdA/CDA1 family)
MIPNQNLTTRRQFIQVATAASTAVATVPPVWAKNSIGNSKGQSAKAQIAITLDLEMARNFPRWTDTHWDYEKGNLNKTAKDYTVRAGQRVKDRGGVIHTFVVGQVFEQENVDWLKQIAADGHPIGNHTYDHIYLLAKDVKQLQYRFRRAPWLLRDRDVIEVIRDNIMQTNTALEKRVGVKANGFRTPGGFATALDGREDLQRLLQALGFDWISCRYPAHAGIRDLHGTQQAPSQEAYENIVKAQHEAQPYVYPTGLIEIPMSPISDIGAFRNGRWQLAHFLKAIRLAMAWVIEHNGVFDFLSHPSCLGVVDPKFQAIDLICDLVEQSQGKAEIVSLEAIAKQIQ